jgi:hypothetical protein
MSQSIHPLSSPFLNLFPKRWPQEFFSSRKPHDDRPYIEDMLESLHSVGEEFDGDDLQMFMESYDDDLTILDIREAIRFMQGKTGTTSLGPQRCVPKAKGTAWLDDRTCSLHLAQHARVYPEPCIFQTLQEEPSYIVTTECDITDTVGEASSSLEHAEHGINGSRFAHPDVVQAVRSYILPLTSYDLQSHLREKRFENPKYLDADRRLIYIADPDADDLAALVRTATAHQQQSLRDVMCKYLSLDTSIKATISEGYSSFHLEFHIPYFALRRSRLDHTFAQRKRRTHRGWMNVGFLNTRDIGTEEDGIWGIHQAQISVTLCGTDNSRWIAYCFEDRHFDEDAELGPDEHTDIHQSDQIANGEFGAEDTIWDSREYFLRVLFVRMHQVHKEWGELLRAIESGIKEHSWGRFFFSSNRDGTPSNMVPSTALNWIESIAQLLDKILDDIGKTNDAWIHFTSVTGDLAYFSDTHANPNMVRTFNKLTDIFSELLVLEKRLRRIADQCEKRAQTVNLRLTSDSMQSAQLTVYFISPFAIVSTFFAIPVPIISFERNLLSFVVAMILYIVFLQLLLFFRGGKIRRLLWWEKLSARAKAVWSGKDSSITENKLGANSLQRRSTQAAYV